jgi:hypothetical protein
MKAIFISYNQAYDEDIVEVLDRNGQRGFTRWQGIQGRGGVDGEPHYGSHAWPVMNDAILVMSEDDRADAILAELKRKDEATPKLGLRAFVLNVEEAV